MGRAAALPIVKAEFDLREIGKRCRAHSETMEMSHDAE
jgi:hypothetical protein